MSTRTRITVAALVVGLAGCSSKPGDNGAGTNGGAGNGGTPHGEVPADMRDVEREGEGLVNTTFGHPPDRAADWDHAQTVLALLKQVWGKAKTASPGLPAKQVKMVDDAIAALDTSIAAKDQKTAAYAANQVGLACPELFDFFHPDSPMGVLRMDAVYRQLGLDAHYGDLVATQKDLDSLKSDWVTTRSAVTAKTPTCHRVGGTQTIAQDIDDSLTAAGPALAAKNAAMVEAISEDGALQVDVLELLFDCPADGPPPKTGIGSPCAAGKCEGGLECDPASNKCAPSSANKIGTPCSSTAECGLDSRSACQNEAGDGYPGGYCSMEPCNDVDVCPPGATCVAIGGETPACLKACSTDGDCRGPDYVCQLFSTTPPVGFGPSDKACAFLCKRNEDCQKPLKCDTGSGKCTP
jgi:hypothetical protein